MIFVILWHVPPNLLHIESLAKTKVTSTVSFVGPNLVTDGSKSEKFYINTRPSIIPDQLICDEAKTSHSLMVKWKYPKDGHFEDPPSQYYFRYNLTAGKLKK